MAETSVFATGADERYGYHLLNLLGSLQVNSDVFDRVVAYDLGLSPHQRGLLDGVEGVEVREVPAFAPHWSQGFTWKPWVWTHLDAGELVFWVDAGDTILRSLAPALERVRERGLFVVGQGSRLGDIVPADYWDLYGVPRELAETEYVAAGIIGFRVGGEFYRRVVVPTYEDCLAGRSLGFSADEVPALNRGLQATEAPVVRDCRHFRWDQTVLNLRLFAAYPEPPVEDMWRYAGWKSPRDHPEQVIWNHRRQGDMRYLGRVRFRPGSRLRGRAFAAAFRLRWWRRMHAKYFSPTTYRLKLARIARSLRGARG